MTAPEMKRADLLIIVTVTMATTAFIKDMRQTLIETKCGGVHLFCITIKSRVRTYTTRRTGRWWAM